MARQDQQMPCGAPGRGVLMPWSAWICPGRLCDPGPASVPNTDQAPRGGRAGRGPDSEAQRLRDRYASFRRRFDARAEAARPGMSKPDDRERT